jgi:Photosynthesis system II assembly factor YCF48
MAADERDRRFERALARHFSTGSGDSACADAEILAAYYERSLSVEEMTKWKEHIAACARCQEALALVEQSENALTKEEEEQHEPERVGQLAAAAMMPRGTGTAQAPASFATPAKGARSPVWRLRPRAAWSWIVPLGAVAASVIVWVGMHEFRDQRAKKIQIALERLPAPLPAPAPRQPQASVTEEREKEEALVAKTKTVPSVQKPGVAASGAPTPQTPSPASPLARKEKEQSARQDASQVQGGVIAGLEPPPSASSYAGNADALQKTPPPPKPEAQPGEPSVFVQQSEKNKKAQLSSAGIAGQSQPSTAAPNMRAAEVVVVPSNNLVQTALTDSRYVVAPGEKHAWRLGDHGLIEVSTDHGKSWKPQSSGVSADLRAGSATSEQVCWVVGRSGTLLLTVDGGKHWSQVSSPITSDLGGVHATDALHASIWDVTNRNSFETKDGGVSWQRVANE